MQIACYFVLIFLFITEITKYFVLIFLCNQLDCNHLATLSMSNGYYKSSLKKLGDDSLRVYGVECRPIVKHYASGIPTFFGCDGLFFSLLALQKELIFFDENTNFTSDVVI